MSLTFTITVLLLALSSLIYVAQYASTVIPQDLGPQVTLSLLIGRDALRSAKLTTISTDSSYAPSQLHATIDTTPHPHNLRSHNIVAGSHRGPDHVPPLKPTHPVDARRGNASLQSHIASFASSAHILNVSKPSSPSSSSNTNNHSRPVKIAPMPSMLPLKVRHGNLSFTSGVASHILTRSVDGTWSPKPGMLRTLPSFDNLLFPTSSTVQQGDPPNGRGWNGSQTTTTHQFLAFIRTTKTGSTSMLNFLNGATKLQTLDKYIRHDEFRQRLANGPEVAMKTAYLTPPCMFGYHLAPGQVAPNKTLPSPGYQCQHLAYHYLVTNFANMLDLYKQPVSPTEPIRVSLDMTTVVRDPVDRYLSYFHYWRSVYPAWNGTAKVGEREALVSGDFEEFLRYVAGHDLRGMNSAFQYEYLSQNVDYSIALLTDRRVLPLLNECFNASLLLVADLYPQFFSLNETLHFLQTSAATTNIRKKVGPDLNVLARRGLEPVKAFDLDAVKARARRWLERDYRFYEASASVFLRYLEASAVDREEVGLCKRRVADEFARLRGDTDKVA